MFNTGIRSDTDTDEKPLTLESTRDEPMREPDVNRKLKFEGTVEVDGTFTGQMLNALFGPDSQVNGRLRFEGAVQIDGTFTATSARMTCSSSRARQDRRGHQLWFGDRQW